MIWPDILITMNTGSLSVILLLWSEACVQDEADFQSNTTDTAQLTNKKGLLHTIFFFPFTNVPISECTLDQASKATDRAAGTETFMTSNQLFCSLLVLMWS